MRKFWSILWSISILLSLALPAFAADDAEAEGICGEDMTWSYADGELTIEGTGYMDDFEEEAPWAEYKDEIRRVVLNGSVEYIGARAFTNYDALETVNFGNSLYEIGLEAFKSCDGLTVIYLPATFKVFGESSFNSCSNLTSIHCSGRFPSFRMNCLWNTFGKIYYPADKPWGTEYIAQLEEAFKGRIEFLASDGTDHYKTEEDEDVTEAPTEMPTEAPTLPPTEAPTTPPTEAPTLPPTEAPTQPAPQTQPPVQPETVPEITPPAAEPEESKSWIGLVIIGAVGAFVLMGMIATALGNRRGRYSKKRGKRKNRR